MHVFEEARMQKTHVRALVRRVVFRVRGARLLVFLVRLCAGRAFGNAWLCVWHVQFEFARAVFECLSRGHRVGS